jgi:hypothetical protein
MNPQSWGSYVVLDEDTLGRVIGLDVQVLASSATYRDCPGLSPLPIDSDRVRPARVDDFTQFRVMPPPTKEWCMIDRLPGYDAWKTTDTAYEERDRLWTYAERLIEVLGLDRCTCGRTMKDRECLCGDPEVDETAEGWDLLVQDVIEDIDNYESDALDRFYIPDKEYP